MDITSLVALPVWIMMPFSMLQNISEIMEYTNLLEKAAKTEDPYERYAQLVMPILSEAAAYATYDMYKHKGCQTTLLAELVSILQGVSAEHTNLTCTAYHL